MTNYCLKKTISQYLRLRQYLNAVCCVVFRMEHQFRIFFHTQVTQRGGICCFMYSLTPRSRVLLEKLTSFQLVEKFPAFYGTRRFITSFTSPCHLSLSWANSIQSIPPHSIPWGSILILSPHLRLRLPSGLFPSGFATKTLCMSLLSSIRATCPAHLILFDFISRAILGEEYRSLSYSLYSFFSTPLSPRPSETQIFSSTPYSHCPQPTLLPHCERPSFTPMHNRHNYSSVCLNVYVFE